VAQSAVPSTVTRKVDRRRSFPRFQRPVVQDTDTSPARPSFTQVNGGGVRIPDYAVSDFPWPWFDPALKDAKIENFHWHDLRHTFASRLRQKGTKLEDIAEALGHKDLMMSKRYAHLGPKGLHHVVAMLDENPTGPRTGPDQVPAQGDNAVRSVN
jgi:integrase